MTKGQSFYGDIYDISQKEKLGRITRRTSAGMIEFNYLFKSFTSPLTFRKKNFVITRQIGWFAVSEHTNIEIHFSFFKGGFWKLFWTTVPVPFDEKNLKINATLQIVISFCATPVKRMHNLASTSGVNQAWINIIRV